jgi:putative flippase GtrA
MPVPLPDQKILVYTAYADWDHMGVADLFNKYREGLLYLFFGGLTTLVCWGVYALLVWFGFDLNVSNVVSLVIGVSFAFVVNKWFVFRSKSLEKKELAGEMISFFGLRLVTILFAIALFPILIHLGVDQPLLGIDGMVAKIVVSIIEIVLNYLASKFIVFKLFRKEKEDAS